MLNYNIVDADEKDIEILTSIKSVTMIDDVMDEKLSYNEKTKIKQSIAQNIKENYREYKLIYIENKIVGAYIVLPHLDGYMIDELYLFSDYRNKGIGTDIVTKIKEEYRKIYVWVYKSNEKAVKLFKKLGFNVNEDNGRILILKYDEICTKVVEELGKIKLGYVNNAGQKVIKCNDNFRDDYVLQSPADLIESGVGLCFDQVELERYLLSRLDINFRTYFLLYQISDLGPAHAFLVFKDHDKYYWIENAWLKYKGVHKYDSKEDALADVVSKFINTIENCDESKIRIYEFDIPRSGSNYTKYIGNAMNGRIVRLSDIKK